MGRPGGARSICCPRPFRRELGKRVAGLTLVGALLIAGGQGGAGHQVGHYPSYYPDEIRIDVIDPAAAAKGLSDETLHAYVGAAPDFAGPLPEHVKSVKSLGSFLVLSFNTTSAHFASAAARCAAAGGVLADLSKEKAGDFVFHPYPVTPYHADYLHHLDLIEAARRPSVAACTGGPRSWRQGQARRGGRGPDGGRRQRRGCHARGSAGRGCDRRRGRTD